MKESTERMNPKEEQNDVEQTNLTPQEEQNMAKQIAANIWQNRTAIARDSAVNTALYTGYAGIKSAAVYVLNPVAAQETVMLAKLGSDAMKGVCRRVMQKNVTAGLQFGLQQAASAEVQNVVRAVQHIGKNVAVGALKSFGANVGITIGFEVALQVMDGVKEQAILKKVEQFKKDSLDKLNNHVIAEVKKMGFNTLEEAFIQAYKDGNATQLSKALENSVQQRQLTLLLDLAVSNLIEEKENYNWQVCLSFLTLGLNLVLFPVTDGMFFVPSLQRLMRPDLNVANMCFGNTLDKVDAPKHEGLANYLGNFIPVLSDGLAIRDTIELSQSALTQKQYDFGYTPCNVAKSEIELIGTVDASAAAKDKLIKIFTIWGNDEYPFLNKLIFDKMQYRPTQIQNSVDAIARKRDKIIAAFATINAKMSNQQQKELTKRELEKQNRFFVDFEKDTAIAEKTKAELRVAKSKEEALAKLEQEVETLKNKFWVKRAIIPALDQAFGDNYNPAYKKELTLPVLGTHVKKYLDNDIVDHYNHKVPAHVPKEEIGGWIGLALDVVDTDDNLVTKPIKIEAYTAGREIITNYPAKKDELIKLKIEIEPLRKKLIDFYYKKVESRYEQEQCKKERAANTSNKDALQVITEEVGERNNRYAQAHAIYAARSLAHTHQLLQVLDELTRKDTPGSWAPTFEKLQDTAKAIFEDLNGYFVDIDQAHPDGLSIELDVLKAELLRTWMVKLITLQKIQRQKSIATLDLYAALHLSLKQGIASDDWNKTYETAVTNHIFKRDPITATVDNKNKNNILGILKVDTFTKELIGKAKENDFKLSGEILENVNDTVFSEEERTKIRQAVTLCVDVSEYSFENSVEPLISLRAKFIANKEWIKLAQLHKLLRNCILFQQTPIFRNNAYRSPTGCPVMTLKLFGRLNIPICYTKSDKKVMFSSRAMEVLLKDVNTLSSADVEGAKKIHSKAGTTIMAVDENTAHNLLHFANEVLSTNASELEFLDKENSFIKAMIDAGNDAAKLKDIVASNKKNYFGDATTRKLLNQLFLQSDFEQNKYEAIYAVLTALKIEVQTGQVDDSKKLRYYLHTLSLNAEGVKLSIPENLLVQPEDFVYQSNKNSDYTSTEINALNTAVKSFFPPEHWLEHRKKPTVLYPQVVHTQLKSGGDTLQVLNNAPNKMVVIPSSIMLSQDEKVLFYEIQFNGLGDRYDYYREGKDLFIVGQGASGTLFFKIQNFEEVLAISKNRKTFYANEQAAFIITDGSDRTRFVDNTKFSQFESFPSFDDYIETNQSIISDGISLEEAKLQEKIAVKLVLDSKSKATNMNTREGCTPTYLLLEAYVEPVIVSNDICFLNLEREKETYWVKEINFDWNSEFEVFKHWDSLIIRRTNTEISDKNHASIYEIDNFDIFFKDSIVLCSLNNSGKPLTVSKSEFETLPHYTDYLYKKSLSTAKPEKEKAIDLSEMEINRRYDIAQHKNGFVVNDADIEKLVDLRKEHQSKKEYKKLAQVNHLIRNLLRYQETPQIKTKSVLYLERDHGMGGENRAFTETSVSLLKQLGAPIIRAGSEKASFDAVQIVLEGANIPVADAPSGLKGDTYEIPLSAITSDLLCGITNGILSTNTDELAFVDTTQDFIDEFSNPSGSHWYSSDSTWKDKVKELQKSIAPHGEVINKNHIYWIRKCIQKLIDKKDFKHIGIFLELMGVHIRSADRQASTGPFSAADFEKITQMLVLNGFVTGEPVALGRLKEVPAITSKQGTRLIVTNNNPNQVVVVTENVLIKNGTLDFSEISFSAEEKNSGYIGNSYYYADGNDLIVRYATVAGEVWYRIQNAKHINEHFATQSEKRWLSQKGAATNKSPYYWVINKPIDWSKLDDLYSLSTTNLQVWNAIEKETSTINGHLKILLDTAALTKEEVLKCKRKIEDDVADIDDKLTTYKSIYNLNSANAPKVEVARVDQWKYNRRINKILAFKEQIDSMLQNLINSYSNVNLPFIELKEVMKLRSTLSLALQSKIADMLALNSSKAQIVLHLWDAELEKIEEKAYTIIAGLYKLTGMQCTTAQQQAFNTLKALEPSIGILSADADEVYRNIYQTYVEERKNDFVTLSLPSLAAVDVDDQKLSALKVFDILLTEVKNNAELLNKLGLQADCNEDVLIEKLCA